MNKPKIFIANQVPSEAEEYLKSYAEVTKWDFSKPKTLEGMKEYLKEANGLLQVGLRIDEHLLSQAPNLKVVSNISVGYNNYDIEAMKKHNIIGTNTPGVLDETVADLIFGLMIGAARRIACLDNYTKSGKWTKDSGKEVFGLDVHHKKLGIIGMGRIGEAVAYRAKFGFSMEILYHNRHKVEGYITQYNAKYCSMESLLREADFIVVMTPLNKGTKHLIGKEQFKLMKSSAIFINASRGAVVDEAALIDALENNKIYAAGLDVYEKEPIDPENPLLKLNNCITLPHIGSATSQTRDAMAMLAARALVEALMTGESHYTVPEFK